MTKNQQIKIDRLMKTWLCVLMLSVPLLALAHPIHVSVCEISQDAEKDQLQVTIKIFADDFNEVLEERTGKKVQLGMEGEHRNTDEYIYDYLKEHFRVKINGKAAELSWVGKEVEDVATWCYLTLPLKEKMNTLSITNSVMMAKFSDQVNVVHVDCYGKMNSTFFSKGKETDSFTFK